MRPLLLHGETQLVSCLVSGCKSLKFILQKHEGCQRFSTGENEQRESIQGGFFTSVTLYCTAGFWLHGDWERAARRLLSFLSVRDGNTHGLWGWLPEILWRGLLLAPTLQARDHISPWLHTEKTEHRMVAEVPTWPPSVVRSLKCTGQVREFSHGEAVMKGDCDLALTLKRQTK